MKHVVIGTAGHIDHGKSALVKALTGINPDRLEEERRRGITIDLGFAHLDLGDGLRVAFIDVPGHERFVKNMLAGATGIDAVLLAVAADESIKPQTREHFDICRLLGVNRGLVAITKSDLVDRDVLDLVRLEIQEFTAGSFLEAAPIVPVSAYTGEGLDALKSELRRLSREAAPKRPDLPLRLPVDRAFVMKGFGAVVTGTLIAGEIEKEMEVEVLPPGRRARVRGIEVHNHAESKASAGQRAALNLAGIEAPEIRRGMVLAPPDTFQLTARLDCSVALLPSAHPLKNRSRVHFHCWTSETVAEVVLLEDKEVRPGENAYAQLRLAQSNLYLPGDRFIIRQFSPLVTLGGGTILDNLPEKHRTADPAQHRLLEALAAGAPEARLELLLESWGEASLAALVARTGWTQDEVMRRAAGLEERARLLGLGQPVSRLVHHQAFRDLSGDIMRILAQFHDRNPLSRGLPKEELRGQARYGRSLSTVPPSPLSFEAALQSLVKGGRIEIKDQAVGMAGREVTMSPEEATAKQEISRAFEAAGLRVPPADEVLSSLGIDGARARKILHILLQENTLHKVTEDLIFHHSALERLRSLLAERKTRGGRISVPAFKELAGVSRKYAIPLLEYLDRERVTRRSGDERVIL